MRQEFPSSVSLSSLSHRSGDCNCEEFISFGSLSNQHWKFIPNQLIPVLKRYLFKRWRGDNAFAPRKPDPIPQKTQGKGAPLRALACVGRCTVNCTKIKGNGIARPNG